MAKEKYPVTPAIRELRKNKVSYEPHVYDYVEKGGVLLTPQRCLGGQTLTTLSRR